RVRQVEAQMKPAHAFLEEKGQLNEKVGDGTDDGTDGHGKNAKPTRQGVCAGDNGQIVRDGTDHGGGKAFVGSVDAHAQTGQGCEEHGDEEDAHQTDQKFALLADETVADKNSK